MERQDPYSTMSQPSSDKSRDPYHSTYADHQDMMLSEDEEESATLAEPMTLEGAKQLAQTSVVVPATTPTPPAVSLASVSPPPHPLVAAPLTSPHHSSHHHHHHHHHHLASPPPPPPPPPHHHHHHLTSPPPPPTHHHLTSPPPPHHHPHITPPLPHHHHMWGPPSVTHEEEEEEEEPQDLPSTVDIQAIRDSPSPDHSKGQLVTINENWDSVEDQDRGDEDSDAYDSDTDGSESDSDSRLSSRSRSASRESIKSRSVSRSPSPTNSKSDSGSQDSDSDSSDWSDSSSSASDDERKKEYEDGDSSPMNKPLPRRKPQLTAPKLTLSEGFGGAVQTDGKIKISPASPMHKSSQLYEKHKSSHLFTSSSCDSIATVGFGVGKVTKVPVLEEKKPAKSSIFSDDETSDGVDSEKNKTVNISVHLSKTAEVRPLQLVPLPKGADSSVRSEPISDSNSHIVKETLTSEAKSVSVVTPGPVGEPKSEKNGSLIEESISRSKGVSESKPSVPLLGLKVEETRTISFQPYKRDSASPPERKCDLTARWEESEKDKTEDGKNTQVSLAELEERRREKELELNREFDRLLFSTKNLNLQQNEQKALVLNNDLSKNPEKPPNDTIPKYNKVYDSPISSKGVNLVLPQSSSWQPDKVCNPSKKETSGSSIDHCTQTFHIENVIDLKDNSHDKNKAKLEKDVWEEKRRESCNSDDKSREFIKDAPDKKEVESVYVQDSSSERTLNKEIATERQLGRESTLESKSNKDASSERNLIRESNIVKKISKELNCEKSLSKDASPDKTPLKEISSEKCLNKEFNSERRPCQILSEKTVKDVSCEKKVSKEFNNLTKNSCNPSLEWRSTKEIICDKPMKAVDVDHKLKKDLCKGGHPDKKCSKDINSDKNIRIEVVEERKLNKEAHTERRGVRDSSLDRRSSKDPSPEKRKIKDATIEKSHSTDAHDIKANEDINTNNKSNGESSESKSLCKLPSETIIAKNDSMEKVLDKDGASDKRAGKNNEKKPSKGNITEKKTSRDSSKESVPEKKNKAVSHEKISKESNLEKQSSKDSTEKKLGKDAAYERKPSKDKKQSKETILDKKQNKAAHFDKKSIKDFSEENKSIKDFSEEKKSIKDFSEEKKSIKDFSEEKKSIKDISEEKKSIKDYSEEKKSIKIASPEKRSNKESHEKRSSKETISDKRLNKELTSGIKIGKEKSPDQRSNAENISVKKCDREPGTEEKTKDLFLEKIASRDMNLERKSRKESSFEKKHRKESSFDKNLCKEQCLQGRYNADNSVKRNSINEPLFEKKSSREPGFDKKCMTELSVGKLSNLEPGFEKGSIKDLDYMKRPSKEIVLGKNYLSSEKLSKLCNLEKSLNRISEHKKRSRKKNKRLIEESFEEKKFSKESCSPTGTSLKKDLPVEFTNNKDLSPKQKAQNERCADDSSEKSKLYRINKIFDNHDELLKVSNISSCESHKSMVSNKVNYNSESVSSVSRKDDKECIRTEESLPVCTKGKTDPTEQSDKLNNKSVSEKTFSCVRPTIADVVKGRERRKSTETEKLSGSEKRKKGDLYREDTSTDSESSEELNEKVDLDTEQTQTFSVSESNFNQGRLTMKIAAMKMAKFGRTGLREVTGGALPTRSDLHTTQRTESSLSMSFSPFRRPRTVPQKPQSANSQPETHKVKTAAERKTYIDALPPNGSVRSLSSKVHRKKVSH